MSRRNPHPAGVVGGEAQLSCAEKASSVVIGALESLFSKIGFYVALRPVPVMVACIIFTLLCASGMWRFTEETDPENLFVPSGTRVLQDSAWIRENFPGLTRFENIIITADDILQPEVIQAIYEIDESLKSITAEDGSYSWESLCYRLGSNCWSNSILELWSFDGAVIADLSRQDILDAVNSITISPVTSAPFVIENYIGGLTVDGTGAITGAEAAYMSYVLFNNDTDINDGPLTQLGMAFESDFIDIASGQRESHVDVINELYYFTQRSQQDEGGGAILDDLVLLLAGYALLVLFVVLVLGQFNLVFHRVWATLAGIFCVLMAIAVSMGLSAWCGLFFGPLHNVLPFLVLGLGVDDMFIIAQAVDSLPKKYWNAPVHVRMSEALKHAGVSITVTSFTDIVAFGVGATTRIPALSSFCIYVCIAIFAVYVFQSTFFVAVMSLDERRSDKLRDACCCCFVHNTYYRPTRCSQISYMQMFFDKIYSQVLSLMPIKVHVIFITLILLAANICGLTLLKQDFDPNWFIPSDSYATDYINTRDTYFAQDGEPTALYLGDVDYYGDFSVLEQLCADIEADPYILEGSVDCWVTSYSRWLNVTDNSPSTDASGFPVNQTAFYDLLQTYLSTASGARFGSNTFNYVIDDGVKYIEACKIPMKHIDLSSATEEIEAMDSLAAVAASAGFDHVDCFAYSFSYGIWEGNRVIRTELYRNLALALLCVLVMSLILLANIWVCLLILTCVVFTLVDVCGLLYFWGLTIDTVTSVNLIIAVGLAVDYSAHVAHTFMTLKGTKNSRMRGTMALIGPAVFYGGLSTLLAFILLSGSNSYVFKTFFKVFLGVTLFGLFHGLAYLPVLLSWIGPKPYLTARDEYIIADKNSGLDAEGTYASHIASWGDQNRADRQIYDDPNNLPRNNFSNGVPEKKWQLPRPHVRPYSNGKHQKPRVHKQQPRSAGIYHSDPYIPHARTRPQRPNVRSPYDAPGYFTHSLDGVLNTGFDSVWTVPR